MNNDLQEIIRILLRYAAMALASGGYVSAPVGAALQDPQIITALSGVVLMVGTEIWYAIKKRADGPTDP